MFHSEKEIIVINLKCNSMKKILSLLLAASAMSLQAQTLLVNDFENGLGGAYVAVDGSCEVIGNPSINDGNNSANVLKITSTNFAQVGFPVSLPNGKTLEIKAPGVSDKKRYVQSLKLNGKVYDKMYITHEDILKGGVLEFKMGASPNKRRGLSPEDKPYSLTNGINE